MQSLYYDRKDYSTIVINSWSPTASNDIYIYKYKLQYPFIPDKMFLSWVRVRFSSSL